MQLRNLVDKKILKAKLATDQTARKTVSFYRYVIIENPEELRDQLFAEWHELGAMGRIYLAREGINAQMSVPEANWEKFVDKLYQHAEFKDVPFKIAVEDDGKSFYKLTIKVRKKIVADGLDDHSFDVTNVGKHLSAAEFNEAMTDKNAIVVDMRNQYESEVGRFEGAICPDVDTFREELPLVLDELKEQKDKKILLYCTGGIRCEKASAYLRHHGFNDVNQLHGGIIDYKHQIDREGLPSKFIGKNFVFDERMGERITEDILSNCHQCGSACDDHTNCLNDACHLLFIQCTDCRAKMSGCCSAECQNIIALPEEAQKEYRRKAAKTGDNLAVYKKRLRPKVCSIA